MSKEILPHPWLRFYLLGGCEISLPGGPVHLETAKTRALLVYLASNPGPQPRHRLMGLLWGELPEAKARRNLRRALWNLRRQLSSPALSLSILSDRDAVCFNREIAYWSDVAAFEAACSYLEPGLLRTTPALHWHQARHAAELYRGEFLQGFYVGDAVAFEEWTLAERERLRAMALRALQHLVAGHAARNQTETALHYARRLLALEPWLEEAHVWLMRLLARSGRRAEALAQFEACQRVLAEELGVEPAQETQALHEQIRSGAFGIPASNLPAPTTPFVGRARELAEIAGLLAGPDCRLLTVTGLGGVGKTRLARELAAQQLAAFAHGLHYVSLGALRAAERLAAALAQSLDIPLAGTGDPGAALLAYLREKQTLLVLDGFEHLLEGATLLAEILQAAPEVKILVTSRERLNLQGEWVYPLAGLECAPDGPAGDPASSDAVRLFLQTARRVYLRFQVREGEDRHLARICNLVSGLPLAIELAAAWVGLLSLEEIAAEIAQHLDFLATTTRDRPPRHRSIRAVFDHSWHLLSDKERDVFRKLSVFRGSFRPQEAGRIGGATLPILSALVDKSLLQRMASGRYQIHELLRQYAREQLAQIPGEPAGVCDLHCQVYAASAAQYHHALRRGPQHRIVTLFTADLEDILSAWQWAIQQRNLQAVAGMWRGLADYYQLRSSFREGEALFREALEALGWPPDQGQAGPATLLPWELLSVQAMFALYLGQFPQARASLERCVAAFARHGVAERVAHCQFFLGEIARFQAELHSAREFYRQSLANYEKLGDRPAMGFCLNGLGLVSSALGDQAQARSRFQESLAAFAETGHEMGQAIVSINLADLLAKLGDHTAAMAILDEGYTLSRELGHRWGMAVCLRHLGDIARLEARTGDAQAAYQEGLEILQDIGHRQASAGFLIKLGEICTDLGDYTAARHHLHTALTLTAQLQDQAQTLAAATALALLLAREGDDERALELALVVKRHPAGLPATQIPVGQLAAELARQLPREIFQRVQGRSSARTLEDLLAESAP